jgi:diguanylate cyclase (GGDEF)-like protein
VSPARLVRWLEERHRATRLVTLLLAVGSIMAIDAATGPDLSVSVFYLIPVAVASWVDGAALGTGISLVCAVAWGYVNHLLPGLPHGPAIAIWNTGVRLAFFLVVTASVDALRRAYRREAALGRTDALTGTLNVRGFREAAELALARCRRSREPVVIMAMDLDDFKRVNDEEGHDAGDRLLELVGSVLRSRFRHTDVVGRLGGDEFAALLPDALEEDARRLIDSLLAHLQDRMAQEGWPAGASAGWCAFETPPASLDGALKVADRRLYEAKAEGKGHALGGPPTP